MTIASAQTIRKLRCFEPFYERNLDYKSGKTYGLGPCTYDMTVEFDDCEDGDPKKISRVLMWPFRSILASTRERFTMPYNYGALVLDKSTWARKFLTAMNTFIDPGFEGYLTLELVNLSPKFFWLYTGTPIVQIMLLELDEPTEIPYRGKYSQQQRGPVKAIHEKHKLRVAV